MTQKPRKGDFGELKSKKKSRGSMPQTYVEVGNRSVFILDPRPTRLALLNSTVFLVKKICVRETLFQLRMAALTSKKCELPF